MRLGRSLALLLTAAGLGGVVMALAYAGRDGLRTFELLLALGAPVLALMHVFARRRARIGSLGRQYLAATGVAVGVSMLGVVLIARGLFASQHDVLLVALLLGFSAGLAAYSAWMLAERVGRDIEAVREGVVAVGKGSRAPAIETSAGDEIAELAAAANVMAAQLAEREAERDAADAARRRLIVGISHDLRTPLTSLQLVGKAVEDGLISGEPDRAYLERIPPLVETLNALIEDLFELSRIEAGDVHWAREPVAVHAIADAAMASLRPEAEASGVEIRNEIPADLRATGNPEKLQRVLCNLIQNSIRHTPADGSVTVAGIVEPDRVEVAVSDTGEGIDPEERAHIFDVFFRGGRQVSRTSRGAGLGLTVSRAIVEAHGGRIWLEDRERGACIRFSLPPVAGGWPETA